MVLIRILDGPESGQTIDFSPGTHIVGRGERSDLVLASDAVSGKHLEITVSEEGVVLFRDLKSTNGTFAGGAKVEEGEWFPGTEIRLGDIRILFDSADIPEADEEDEDRRAEARAEVLAGGRKSKPLLAIAAVLVLATAGGLAWILQQEDDGGNPAERAPMAEGRTPSGPVDLLEGLGSFAAGASEAWDLGDSLKVESESLRLAGGRARALLARRFSVPAASLLFRARVQGMNAWPLVEWGGEGEDRAEASWMGPNLADGPSGLPLPAEASWYRLTLVLEGAGSLADLVAEEGEDKVQSSKHEGRQVLASGGNLILRHRDGRDLLHAQSASGTWTSVEGGLAWKSNAAAPIVLRAGDALRETGPVQLLAEGGPVGTSPGVSVESTPGLILGGEARRMMVRSTSNMQASCVADGGVALIGSSELALSWELTPALQEAALLAREIERSSREEDHRALLEKTAELLRDWPLDETKVARALELSGLAISAGREELSAIQESVGEALFLDSIPDMAALADRAAALAARLPGTGIDDEALAAESLLRLRGQELLATRKADNLAYRNRLVAALSGVYPVVATWLEAAP